LEENGFSTVSKNLSRRGSKSESNFNALVDFETALDRVNERLELSELLGYNAGHGVTEVNSLSVTDVGERVLDFRWEHGHKWAVEESINLCFDFMDSTIGYFK